MKTTSLADLWRDRRRLLVLLVCGIAAVGIGAAGMYVVTQASLFSRSGAQSSADSTVAGEESGGENQERGEGESGVVRLPEQKWSIAGLRIQPVELGSLQQNLWVTGKLTVNEDRLAHIYSLVEGLIHKVNVRYGQDVKQGDVLAVVDSKEVGAAKLALYGYSLQADFAKVNNEWNQKINQNTQELIAVLRKEPPITDLEQQFVDKPMGEYRQQLVSAYASLYKSQADYERLTPLADRGIAAGKQVLAAKAAFEADRATFLALLEQLKFTAWQQALLAEQKLQQAERSVAVSRSQLYILGYHETDLDNIDPVAEGESISHFEIRAPFSGTVIGKNVVLAERVGPDTELFRLADLSTVWLQADIYQKDLPKLEKLGDTLRFRAPSSDHEHEAKIFYSGDVLDPETRTMRLTALVDNPDRHLKPGMFVEVALPGETVRDVLSVPAAAIQEIDGQSLVFVHMGGDQFERRDVSTGTTSDGRVEILAGLKPGEPVVVAGGFTLKSEVLKELMTDDD